MDATNREGWAYFSFAKGDVLEVADPENSMDWGLEFQRTKAKLNGGVGGAGKRSVVILKDVEFEGVKEAPADVYVLFESGLKSIGGVGGLLKVPGLAQTRTGRNQRVVAMDGLYLSGFDPRCGQAALDLFRSIL